MKIGEPTLDQLRIFIAVAEHGSFGAAARAMGRAVSAISYGIAGLEGQLGITLFEREGSRKPVLTEAGTSLLSDANAIADRVDGLLAKTQGLHEGLESRIALVIDVIIPGEATAKVLSAFRDRFPTVTLELLIEGLGAVTQKLLSEEASIGIGGPVTSEHPALERRRLGEVALIPVAAPDHPLARAIADGEDIIGQSRQHLQLVLADRSDLTEGREFSVISPHTWRLGDLGAKHSLLKEGLGWGNMPRAMIAEDLANGTLVELDLPEAPGANYSLTGLWLRKAQPRPAGRWLMDEFEKQLARCA